MKNLLHALHYTHSASISFFLIQFSSMQSSVKPKCTTIPFSQRIFSSLAHTYLKQNYSPEPKHDYSDFPSR